MPTLAKIFLIGIAGIVATFIVSTIGVTTYYKYFAPEGQMISDLNQVDYAVCASAFGKSISKSAPGVYAVMCIPYFKHAAAVMSCDVVLAIKAQAAELHKGGIAYSKSPQFARLKGIIGSLGGSDSDISKDPLVSTPLTKDEENAFKNFKEFYSLGIAATDVQIHQYCGAGAYNSTNNNLIPDNIDFEENSCKPSLTAKDLFPNTPDIDLSNLDKYGRLAPPWLENPTLRVLPNMKVFHTNKPQDYISKLRNNEVLVHLPSQDSIVDGPAYAIDTMEHVLIVEKATDKERRFSYAEDLLLKEFDNFTKEQVKVMYDEKLYDRMIDVRELLITFENNAFDYPSSQGLMDYVYNLPLNDRGSNVEKIYNKVQDALLQNNTAAHCLEPKASMSCGVGVCRNGATYLGEALKANGVNAAFVFSDNHAWVRVNNDGSGSGPYDLDTNAYESFIKLPPRNVTQDQIVPIVNFPKKK